MLSLSDNVKLLKEHNYNLTPNKKNTKKAFEKNWPHLNIELEKLLQWVEQGCNMAIVLAKKDLVIDVDLRHGGLESFKQLQKDLGVDLTPSVITATEGYHVYLQKEEGVFLPIKVKQYPGIEFLSKGRACTIPGSTIDSAAYRWYNDTVQIPCKDMPKELLKLCGKDKPIIKTIRKLDTDAKEIERKLSVIDPDLPYDDWIKIGMALHSYDEETGLILWQEWSMRGEKYRDGDMDHWHTFDSKKGTTIRTVNHYFRKELEEKEEKINTRIEKIKNEEDISEICNDMRELDQIEKIASYKKEIFCKSLQKHCKENLKIKPPSMKSFQDVFTNKRENIDRPEWVGDWIYVDSHNAYFHIPSKTFYSKSSVNAQCGIHMTNDENNNKQDATDFMSKNGFLRVAHTAQYLPQEKDVIIKDGERLIVNTYEDSNRPSLIEITEDNEHVNIITTHLKDVICNGDEKLYKILVNWIAHNIQYPGKKIRWAIIIKSEPGSGKSFIGEMLTVLMGGNENVKPVSSTLVYSQFNDYAANSCVNILEELKSHGSNRYEFLNAIKPLITDKYICINGKFKKPYRALNTTNYIGFTNHDDCLPMEKGDRRWCIIKCEMEGNKLGNEYYDKLHDVINNHAADVYSYFMTFEINKDFMNLHRAPITEHKIVMEYTENEMKPGYHEVEELLKKGCKSYNQDFIVSSALFRDLENELSKLNNNPAQTSPVLSNNDKNLLLKRLGYSILFPRITVDGTTYKKIWTKRLMSKEQVRNLLQPPTKE